MAGAAAGTTVTSPTAPALIAFLAAAAMLGGAGAAEVKTDDIDQTYFLEGLAEAVATDIAEACSNLQTAGSRRLLSDPLEDWHGELHGPQRLLLQKPYDPQGTQI